MKFVRLFIGTLFMMILTSGTLQAEEIYIDGQENTTIDMVYFYVNVCASCTDAQDLIDSYVEQIKASELEIGIRLIAYNLRYYSGPEYDYYLAYMDHFAINPSEAGTPLLIVGDDILMGETAIEEGLPSLLEAIQKGERPETLIVDQSKKDEPDNVVEFIRENIAVAVVITAILLIITGLVRKFLRKVVRW